MLEFQFLRLREIHLYGRNSAEDFNLHIEQRFGLIDPLHLSCERSERPCLDSDDVTQSVYNLLIAHNTHGK